MKIIAGTHRGRPVITPRGQEVTRPIPDRIKKSLFAVLGPETLEGARVADLFAGSGTLGLEALSRGANHCTFIERDRAAAGALRRNLAALDLAGRARVVQANALRWRCERSESVGYDLVFVDPPYRLAAGGHVDPLLRQLDEHLPLAPDALVVYRHETGTAAADTLGPLLLADRRRHGKMTISIYRYAAQQPPPQRE